MYLSIQNADVFVNVNVNVNVNDKVNVKVNDHVNVVFRENTVVFGANTEGYLGQIQ